jgi:hypothetical protein
MIVAFLFMHIVKDSFFVRCVVVNYNALCTATIAAVLTISAVSLLSLMQMCYIHSYSNNHELWFCFTIVVGIVTGR